MRNDWITTLKKEKNNMNDQCKNRKKLLGKGKKKTQIAKVKKTEKKHC